MTAPAGIPTRVLLLVPGALLAGLAFQSGGFFPGATAVAAVIVLAALIVWATTAGAPFAAVTRLLAVAGSALVGFAVLQLVSSGWSDSAARAVLEYQRTLLYLGALVLFGLLGRSGVRAQTLVAGLGAGAIAVAVAALAVWLLPGTFGVGGDFLRTRLSWPTSYWNATGLLAALGAVWCLQLSARGGRRLRVAWAAGLPLLVSVVWFSVSRGAAAAGAIGVVAYLATARDRAAVIAFLAAVPAVAAAVLVDDHVAGIAAAHPTAAALDAGRRAALLLVACAVGAAVLRAAASRLEDRPRRRERRIAPHRVAIPLAIVAAVAATAATAVFVAADGPHRVHQAYSRFASADPVAFNEAPGQRFTRLGNNGRIAHWRVALDDGFSPHPWHGSGAGTYALLWAAHRETNGTVLDAHSLYVETLGELGIPGLFLLLVVLISIVVALARRLRDPERAVWAALLATTLAWLVHAGIDWDWEMPAVSLWVFAAGGLALSAPVRAGVPGGSRRALRLAAGLGLLALALVPIAVARSQTDIEHAVSQLRAGDCPAAIDSALDARDALGVRSEPYEVLAYCDVRLGRGDLARRAIREAIDRDPGSWDVHYGEALVLGATGGDPRPAARAAFTRNPLHAYTKLALRLFKEKDRALWRRRALAAPLPLGVG